MKNFRLRMASIVGLEHAQSFRNNQDAVVCFEGDDFLLGVICDGSSTRSVMGSDKKEKVFLTKCEVGANLLAESIKEKAVRLLFERFSISVISKLLYNYVLDYLNRLLLINLIDNDIEKQIYYITHYLTATIIGFMMTKKQGVIFSAGDGQIILNNKLEIINQNNQPDFISYHLLPKENLPASIKLVNKFRLRKFKTTKLKNLAIASDGFRPELKDEIWHKVHFKGLQRQFVIWSRAGNFIDDASIVTVEKVN